MKIEETGLPGVFVIGREPFADERGSFARVFCKRELEEAGLCGDIAQINLSANNVKGTLRGLHAQFGENAEDKIVTCGLGAVFDVCVDVREGSPTFGKWFGTELSAENGLALYVPKGFAHGYLTLCDGAQVMYFVTQFYNRDAEVGYRWDDPAFSIKWPLEPPFVISGKDGGWPYVKRERSGNYFVEPIVIERQTPGELEYKEFETPAELCGYFAAAAKKKGSPKLSIAIMSHRNIESLKICVACVLGFAAGIDYELVLMDNASDDDDATYNLLRDVPYGRKKVIKMLGNMGSCFNAARGWNELWSHCGGDYILHLNDDHFITENAVQNMIKALDSDPSIGMVNPVSSNAWMRQDPRLQFSTWEEMFEKAKEFNIYDPRKWEERIYVAAVAWMFRREVLPYLCCSNPFGPELCYDIALRNAGYRVMLLADTWVHHNHDYSKKESYGFTGDTPEKIKQREYIARATGRLSFGLNLFEDIGVLEKQLVSVMGPPKNEKPSLLAVDVRAGQGLLDLKNQLRQNGVFNSVSTAFSTQAKYYPLLYTVADEVIINKIRAIGEALGERRFDYCVVGTPLNCYENLRELMAALMSKLNPGGELLYKLRTAGEPSMDLVLKQVKDN